MPSLTNRLKLALPNGNEYVNRAALNKIFEDIDRLVMLQGDFDTAKKEIDDNLAKKVSKSGDTMTGNLKLPRLETTDQTPVIFNGNTNNRSWKWDMLGDNLSVTPTNSSAPGWDFSKTVTLQNLLKKTGDTMTDKLWFSGASKGIAWQENSKEVADLIYNGRNIFLRGKPLDGTVYNAVIYDIDKNYFNVQSETNLVKKSGDTMNGNFHVEVNDAPDKRIAWVNKDNLLWGFTTNADKSFQMYDWKNKKSVWAYDGNLFDMKAETNLLKKTGDTMTGSLLFDAKTAERNLTWQTSNGDISFRGRQNGVFSLRDWSKNLEVFSWDGTTFSVNTDTNLLKKTGDTATGEMTFRHNIQQQSSDGKNGIVSVINLSQTKWAVGPRVEGTVDWSKELSMSLVTGEVSVAGLKVKGERALTISDGEEKTPSRSGKDENGIFTTYEETQEDGKLSKRSVLSSPDADGNYLVRTVTYYRDGVAYKTKIFDLKYDEDGDFVKAVPR